ncbi:hypothetical protein HRbin34_00380 [bacterium HR34]|nr:hypothetical protein HRbin34_00380 [bacterium HR34]
MGTYKIANNQGQVEGGEYTMWKCPSGDWNEQTYPNGVIFEVNNNTYTPTNISATDQTFGTYGDWAVCVKAVDTSNNETKVCKNVKVINSDTSKPIISESFFKSGSVDNEVTIKSDGTANFEFRVAATDNNIYDSNKDNSLVVTLREKNKNADLLVVKFDKNKCYNHAQFGYAHVRCPNWNYRYATLDNNKKKIIFKDEGGNTKWEVPFKYSTYSFHGGDYDLIVKTTDKSGNTIETKKTIKFYNQDNTAPEFYSIDPIFSSNKCDDNKGDCMYLFPDNGFLYIGFQVHVKDNVGVSQIIGYIKGNESYEFKCGGFSNPQDVYCPSSLQIGNSINLDKNNDGKPDLSQGTYNLCVKAVDFSNNTAEKCKNFNIISSDKTPPYNTQDKYSIIFKPATLIVGNPSYIRLRVEDNWKLNYIEFSVDNNPNNTIDSGENNLIKKYICDNDPNNNTLSGNPKEVNTNPDIFEVGNIWECPSASANFPIIFDKAGTYELCFKARDEARNESTACQSFEVSASGSSKDSRPNELTDLKVTIKSEFGSGNVKVECKSVDVNSICESTNSNPNPVTIYLDQNEQKDVIFKVKSDETVAFPIEITPDGGKKQTISYTLNINPLPVINLNLTDGKTKGGKIYDYRGNSVTPLKLEYSISDDDLVNFEIKAVNGGRTTLSSGSSSASGSFYLTNLATGKYYVKGTAKDGLSLTKGDEASATSEDFYILKDISINSIECSKDGMTYGDCSNLIVRAGQTFYIKAMAEGSENIDSLGTYLPIVSYNWDYSDIANGIEKANCSNEVCIIKLKEERFGMNDVSINLTVQDQARRQAVDSVTISKILPPLPKIKETSFFDKVISGIVSFFAGLFNF